jgi:hypothetical protein
MKMIQNTTTRNRGFFAGVVTVESEQGDRGSIRTQGNPTHEIAAERVLRSVEEITVQSLRKGQQFFAPFGDICTFDSYAQSQSDEADILEVKTATKTISYGRDTTVIAFRKSMEAVLAKAARLAAQ